MKLTYQDTKAVIKQAYAESITEPALKALSFNIGLFSKLIIRGATNSAKQLKKPSARKSIKF